MKKITTYDFIESNTKKTIFLMVLFPITLIILTYLAIFVYFLLFNNSGVNQKLLIENINQIAIIVLPLISLFAIFWIVISYFFGHSIVLNISGAREINKNNYPQIFNMTQNLAISQGLPMPKIYMINDSGLNAFATGRDPKHSYIALTRGIVEVLEPSELECVIAHEMSHIKNRDIRLMLIMVVCISFSTIIAEILLRAGLFSNRNSKDSGRVLYLLLAIVFYLYGYLVAPLIKLAVSRAREFQADAGAALMTRNPQGLISALKKISNNSQVESLKDKESISAMCIETPLSKDKKSSLFSKLSGLFQTHPPIEERIRVLGIMDSE